MNMVIRYPAVRIVVQNVLDYSKFGFVFDILSTVISFFSVVIYVLETYQDHSSEKVGRSELP